MDEESGVMEPPEAPEAPRESGRRDSFSAKRLVFFVVLHLLAFLGEVAAIGIFLHSRDLLFASCLLVPLFFSGFFCSYTAWTCEMPRTGCGLFPLKKWTVRGVLLLLPMGFLQGVIIWLAFEEYYERNATEVQGRTAADPLVGGVLGKRIKRSPPNKYHCKAVNGLFEGIATTMVLLYAFWSLGVKIGDPPEPITELKYPGEGFLVGALGMISFVSTGLGLMELDCCTSKTIEKRMSSSGRYEAIHCLFRTCEVTSRVCMFAAFMVLTRESVHFRLWWCILLADFCLTAFFVSVLGGAENRCYGWLLRLLCSFPCVFANIFAFVDAPNKCRAAKMVFRCLTSKHAIEQVSLPLLLYWGIGGERVWKVVQEDWKHHWFMILVAGLASVLYWPLLLYISMRSFHRSNITDGFSACNRGRKEEVQAAIRETAMDVNQPDVDGVTPLMMAAAKGHADVCKVLVEQGAKVDVKRDPDNRPCRAFVSCLSASVAYFVQVKWTALHLAAWYEWTALHIAAWCGHNEVVKVLVEGLKARQVADESRPPNDWRVSFEGANNRTPLNLALEENHVEVVRYLGRQCVRWKDAARADHRYWESLPVTARDALLELSTPQAKDDSKVTWPEEEIVIKNKKHLIAPGLCSYLVDCCGGALGHALDVNLLEDAGSTVNIDSDARPDQSAQNFQLSTLREQLLNLETIRELGRGSFGAVYHCKDKDNEHNEYAVKKIREKPGTGPLNRREFEVASRIITIPHPCLVKLVSVTYDKDRSYTLVMEFCPNGTLQSRIDEIRRKEGPKNYKAPPEAVAWVGQIFLGLEHLHLRMNTLLCDLKPDNVVLSTSNCAKLTDFGGRFGVKPVDDVMAVGTPGYWAPEAAVSEPYGFPADLFSLGALAWVLFSGGLLKMDYARPPTIHDTAAGSMEVNLGEDYRELQKCLEDPESNAALRLNEQQQDFVAKLIAREPGKRLKHKEIRNLELLQSLSPQLPSLEHPPEAVKMWLDEIMKSVRAEEAP